MIKTELCEEEDGRVVMHFEGRLDTPEAEKVKHDMERLCEYHDRDIVLDMTNLKYVCSSGLRLFLNLLKESRLNGCDITVIGLSEYLHRVFDETGFTRLFKLD
jgi:anti-anti-sigma factor